MSLEHEESLFLAIGSLLASPWSVLRHCGCYPGQVQLMRRLRTILLDVIAITTSGYAARAAAKFTLPRLCPQLLDIFQLAVYVFCGDSWARDHWATQEPGSWGHLPRLA